MEKTKYARKIDSMGRITIPIRLREELGLEIGEIYDYYTTMVDGNGRNPGKNELLAVGLSWSFSNRNRKSKRNFKKCGVDNLNAPLANVQRRISINYQLWKIFTEIGAPDLRAPAPETADRMLPSQTGCSHVYKILAIIFVV